MFEHVSQDWVTSSAKEDAVVVVAVVYRFSRNTLFRPRSSPFFFWSQLDRLQAQWNIASVKLLWFPPRLDSVREHSPAYVAPRFQNCLYICSKFYIYVSHCFGYFDHTKHCAKITALGSFGGHTGVTNLIQQRICLQS